MTNETVQKINKMKNAMPDFTQRIASTLIDFKQFQLDSGKSTNQNVMDIFVR